MTTFDDDPFRPADREQFKARIALTGPAGSGKTYTALMLATTLADRVAAIDTERGKMLEHATRFKFSHYAPSRFDPRDLIKQLAKAAHYGYGAVVIDSLSHYWMGEGGALEFVDSYEGKVGGKFQSGWKDFRPIENAMWSAIMGYPGHVIATMRVQTAYEIERDTNGKPKPVKVGMKPVQRDSMDYEFSILGEMDRAHALTITKSTCEDLVDGRFNKPGIEVAQIIENWCQQGVAVPDALEYRERALEAGLTVAELRGLHNEVKERQLLGAAVIDEHGDDTNLGDLIVRLGHEARALETAAAVAARATSPNQDPPAEHNGHRDLAAVG